MAIDPVQQVNIEEYDAGFSTNLGAALREIARYEPSADIPYLSVYLDWRPEGERPYRRAAVTVFENEVRKLFAPFDEESAAWESLNADYERIKEFLVEDLDPSVQGVMIFANYHLNIFDTFVLAIPLENKVAVGPRPDLLPMAQVVEDFPRYAVLMANQQEASLMVISRASRIQQVSIEGTSYPPDQKQGGWSQQRYQDRADERKSHFARAIAEQTRQALREADVGMLVVDAGEVMRTRLDDEFHEDLKDKIIGWVSTDRSAENRSEIIEKTMPVIIQHERSREYETVQTLLNEVRSGGQGVLGAAETLEALERGQVMTLVMSSDFHEEGWADYEMNIYGIGPVPTEHPAGGNVEDLHGVDLAEEMVRLTVVTDATGEIIHGNGAVDIDLGDFQVGAILRFANNDISGEESPKS